MRQIFIMVIFSFGIFSCEKDVDLNTKPPLIPQTVNYDPNGDGVDDISFKVGPDDVVTDGTVGYYGYIYPLNGGLLFVPNRNERTWVLDNQLNDTIKKGVDPKFSWYPSNLGFIGIDDSPQGVWPNEWTISSTKPSNPYYLGIQIKEKDIFLVGWIKLEIDKKTGNTSILDHNLTSGDYIVIDR